MSLKFKFYLTRPTALSGSASTKKPRRPWLWRKFLVLSKTQLMPNELSVRLCFWKSCRTTKTSSSSRTCWRLRTTRTYTWFLSIWVSSWCFFFFVDFTPSGTSLQLHGGGENQQYSHHFLDLFCMLISILLQKRIFTQLFEPIFWRTFTSATSSINCSRPSSTCTLVKSCIVTWRWVLAVCFEATCG